jgi:hypothetical protein
LEARTQIKGNVIMGIAVTINSPELATPLVIQNAAPDASGKVDVFNMGVATSIQLLSDFGVRITNQANDIEQDTKTLETLTPFLAPDFVFYGGAGIVANSQALVDSGLVVNPTYTWALGAIHDGITKSYKLPPIEKTFPYDLATWNYYSVYTFPTVLEPDPSGNPYYFAIRGYPPELVGVDSLQPYLDFDSDQIAALKPKIKEYVDKLTQGAQGKQAFLQDLILQRDRYLNAATNFDERGASTKRTIIDAFKA